MGLMRDQFFEVDPGLTLEQLEEFGNEFARMQRGVMWWIGDLAMKARDRWGDDFYQVFPEWVSPGLVARAEGVSRAYPNEKDRNPLCTWSQHMQVAKKPDRLALLAEIADRGLTTDESRKEASGKSRWLLAIDCNYHIHRNWFSGAGVEAAIRVTEWIQRTVARLKEKGLTDVVCCFDSRSSFRKELTAEWEDKYKDRPKKDDELVQQITLLRELLEGAGFLCIDADGFEADDLLASYAVQFQGKVTILAKDKDMKQCLSEKCNMLLDVEWIEDTTSGDMLPDYKWLSAKQHTEETGIAPSQWQDYQAICGDNVDGIKGAPGIGTKGAADLIKEFGSLDSVIQAARDGDERIKPKKREALIELADRVDIVRQLVTLRADVRIPMNTRIT